MALHGLISDMLTGLVYLYISSRCISGVNEKNCALNVIDGLDWTMDLPESRARGKCLSSAGKAGCSLADSPGKSPPGLRPATREFAGRECLSAAGKAQVGSPGRVIPGLPDSWSLRAASKPL